MIILSYVIFDQQLKNTFRKSPAPPPIEKIHSPLLKNCWTYLSVPWVDLLHQKTLSVLLWALLCWDSCKNHFCKDNKRLKIIKELSAKNNFKDGNDRNWCLLFGNHTEKNLFNHQGSYRNIMQFQIRSRKANK